MPGGAAYDTEFGLWASLIMDIALDPEGDGRAGVRQGTRVLDEVSLGGGGGGGGGGGEKGYISCG